MSLEPDELKEEVKEVKEETKEIVAKIEETKTEVETSFVLTETQHKEMLDRLEKIENEMKETKHVKEPEPKSETRQEMDEKIRVEKEPKDEPTSSVDNTKKNRFHRI